MENNFSDLLVVSKEIAKKEKKEKINNSDLLKNILDEEIKIKETKTSSIFNSFEELNNYLNLKEYFIHYRRQIILCIFNNLYLFIDIHKKSKIQNSTIILKKHLSKKNLDTMEDYFHENLCYLNLYFKFNQDISFPKFFGNDLKENNLINYFNLKFFCYSFILE